MNFFLGTRITQIERMYTDWVNEVM